MKRYNSNLKEYSKGKYILHKDHLEELEDLKKDHLKEVEDLKKEIRKLKHSSKAEPSTSSSYNRCCCGGFDPNYNYNGGWG